MCLCLSLCLSISLSLSLCLCLCLSHSVSLCLSLSQYLLAHSQQSEMSAVDMYYLWKLMLFDHCSRTDDPFLFLWSSHLPTATHAVTSHPVYLTKQDAVRGCWHGDGTATLPKPSATLPEPSATAHTQHGPIRAGQSVVCLHNH